MITGPKEKKYVDGKPDKREVSRIKLGSIVSIDSGKWDLELSKPVNAPEMENLLSKYRDKSLEGNFFFEKTFLAAAFARMNTHETSLITVWETLDTERSLRMYFPMVQEKIGFPGIKAWRCWSHDYAPLGVPIVSEVDSGEVIDRFLQLLGQIENSAYCALVFPDIPLKGVFASRLREALEISDTPYCEKLHGARAILKPDKSTSSGVVLDINSKKRRNLQRQLRRLGELGQLELESVKSYKDVILRFEEFLLLEARSWKGNKGTSMHTIKKTAAFARQAVTQSAKENKCTIYSIRLDGNSVASLIMLNSDGVFYPWKIAFDQNFSLYSPGSVLIYLVSKSIGAEPGFVRSDSLAGFKNNLMNPLWKQRMELGSIILPIGNGARSCIENVSGAIERKNKLTILTKQLLKRGGK